MTDGPTAADVPTVVVHETEACECCGRYEDHLAGLGVTVEIELHDDIALVKDDLGVPDDQRSCHTDEVAGYVVEGHVPVEAIAALLDEAPDVDGIALAGMPTGSPGMPGEPTEAFVVTTFVDGAVIGELGRPERVVGQHDLGHDPPPATWQREERPRWRSTTRCAAPWPTSATVP